MNKYIQQLIEDVADNNLNYAKQDIRNILERSNNQADREFRERVLGKLNTSFAYQQMPAYLQGILTVEDVSNRF